MITIIVVNYSVMNRLKSKMKRIFIIIPCMLAVSCTMSDQDIRHAYSVRYQQNPDYVATYKDKISQLDVNQLAEIGAEMDQKRLNGHSRLKIDSFIYIEKIGAKQNAVVYDYSLTDSWKALGQPRQQEFRENMQKDLIYRTCSLKTVRLAQEKGLEEIHHYYDDYPNHIAFTLSANLALCKQNGF